MNRAPSPSPSAVALRTAFRSLEHRNFRLFFAGQGVSLVGTWMQQVAMSWLVWRMTGSAFWLGAVGFATQLPTFILAPVAGVLADRWSRHRMVIATQAASMAQAVVLAALVLGDVVAVWHLVALALVLGTISGFDIPARQSFFVQLVGPESLANAIALNATMFNAARLVGPALAGFLVAAVGEGIAFLLNALSFVAVLASLLAMRVAPVARPASRRHVLADLREGLSYAWRFRAMRAALLLLGFVSLVGMPYAVLMPIFASEVLRGDAKTLGVLMSAAGLGALAAALFLASRPSVRGLGRVIVAAALLFGAFLVALSFARVVWLAAASLVFVGFGVMALTASINTVLQTLADEDKRGRVVSLYVAAFMGMGTFGTLLAGALASRIGAPATVALGGAACVVAGALFARRLPAWREEVRPIYRRLGIIPEVAEGLQTATELRPRG